MRKQFGCFVCKEKRREEYMRAHRDVGAPSSNWKVHPNARYSAMLLFALIRGRLWRQMQLAQYSFQSELGTLSPHACSKSATHIFLNVCCDFLSSTCPPLFLVQCIARNCVDVTYSLLKSACYICSLQWKDWSKVLQDAALVKLNNHMSSLLFAGKSQLSELDVTRTRRIASLRIHVERAINRIKTYRIFKSALTITSRRTISDMVFICAGLCNLKAPLIATQETAASASVDV